MSYCRVMTIISRLAGAIAISLAVACATADHARAQALPFGGVMPDTGAMDYDLVLTTATSPRQLRMTGFATQRHSRIFWINCTQPKMIPVRTCRLMIDGEIGENFPLPPDVDLGRWMTSRLGPRWPPGGYGSGPDGAMETRGQWRMGAWMAKGRFRYWR